MNLSVLLLIFLVIQLLVLVLVVSILLKRERVLQQRVVQLGKDLESVKSKLTQFIIHTLKKN